ncbi:TrkH family potassium uptake protein [Fuchsiella alkaliacetigena]|uniref:TrkH family potassium uptake protein n=1 Tax=Fuchsiella alkaliacetigena TaxID=957042 RepID=UPI00200A0151|nr:potassium transporter TrkG [Fuchsiella alkaliacetigena]MCK8825049.1 TrkH family potassium uptake protein [Fuchsiella alkaliacetigena]
MRYIEVLKNRYRLIVKYLGILTIAVGFFLLLPLLFLVFYPSEIDHLNYFLWPALLAISLGLIFWKFGKNNSTDVILSLEEGGIIVLGAWIIAILFSSFPFLLADKLNFTNAIFEAVSGWTTTGLSVINEAETSNLFLLWRSLMQFFGGAGLAVIMLSAIIGPHGLGLYQAEGRSDKLLPHVRRSTKLIMTIYSGYTLAGIVLYWLAGMSLFHAFNHSIAALSTGGFSTKVASIGAWNSISIELITYILMLLGTINFATHYVLLRGDYKTFFKNGEIRILTFLMTFFIPIIAYFSLQGLYESLGQAWRVSIFSVISGLSTTGFSIEVFSNWNDFGILAMVILMLIGGGTGSTAGGIKLYRIYLSFKSLVWNLKSHFQPENIVVKNYIWRGEKKLYIEPGHVREIANYILLYLITYFTGVLIFLTQGYKLQESMFEFASALSTVGLSIGITAPDAPKIILWTEIVGMTLGRLEFFVIFFATVKLIRDLKLIARSN